jgi:hypothetical protein
LRSPKFVTLRPEAREPAKPYTSRHHPKQWVLKETSITNLLELNLAATLKTLHLDLANFFRTMHANRTDYCVWVARLLPKLSHARMRLPRICPDCFGRHHVPSQQPEYELPACSLKTLAVCVSVCDVWCGDVWRDESLFHVYAHRCRIPTDIQVNSSEANVISEPNRTHLLDSIKSLASR